MLADPNERTWEDAYPILLKPYMTLWRAVLDVDPTFPRRKPLPGGRRVGPWPRIPDQLLLLRAIRHAQRSRP